jgi:hypothetical protein
LFHRAGHEESRREFIFKSFDHTLSIDEKDCTNMLRLAHESQGTIIDIDYINLFKIPLEAHQKMKHGVVPSQLFADEHGLDDSYDTNESVLVETELSQELGGKMTEEEGGKDGWDDKTSHFISNTMRTGN